MRAFLLRSTAATATLLFNVGCRQAPLEIRDIVTVYRFENVRIVDEVAERGRLDEWDKIVGVLKQGKLMSLPGEGEHPSRALYAAESLVRHDAQASEEFRTGVPGMAGATIAYAYKDQKRVGNILIRDYIALLKAGSIRDLETIHRGLETLSQKKFGASERVEFKITEAECQLGYISNYVQPEIEITLRGRTDPRATVTLFKHVGDQIKLSGPDWETVILLVPDHNFVYGYSTVTTPRGESVTKYFRINVFTQHEESLDGYEFDRLRRNEP